MSITWADQPITPTGYTPRQLACQYDVAVHHCQQDARYLIPLAAGALLLPGWWKALGIAVLIIKTGMDEFGGPSCASILTKKVRPIPGVVGCPEVRNQ